VSTSVSNRAVVSSGPEISALAPTSIRCLEGSAGMCESVVSEVAVLLYSGAVLALSTVSDYFAGLTIEWLRILPFLDKLNTGFS